MNQKNKRVWPAPLSLGDTVAVICPAGVLPESEFNQTVKALQKFGFCVLTYPKRSKKGFKYFSAEDEVRAAELKWALEEPIVKAVFCCRGGYGSMRTVDAIGSVNPSSPKIVCGFSDITYLHQWIQNQWGWVTLHSPLIGKIKDSALNKFLKELITLSHQPESWKMAGKKQIQKGEAKGLLVGGNLSLLDTQGPAALPLEDVILAIEDVGEDHYRLDRMLRRLEDSGYGAYVKGIVLGTFYKCGQKDKKIFPWSWVEDSLRRLTSGPIISGAPFGHGLSFQKSLPLGAEVFMQGKEVRLL